MKTKTTILTLVAVAGIALSVAPSSTAEGIISCDVGIDAIDAPCLAAAGSNCTANVVLSGSCYASCPSSGRIGVQAFGVVNGQLLCETAATGCSALLTCAQTRATGASEDASGYICTGVGVGIVMCAWT